MPWILDEISGAHSKSPDFGRVDGQIYSGGIAVYSMPLESGDLPLRMIQTNDVPPADYVMGPFSGMILVSAAIKECLEGLEPNVHHFYPIELTRQSGESVPGKMFLFKPGNILKGSIIVEKSEVGVSWLNSENRSIGPLTQHPRITWVKEKVQGKHAWVDEECSISPAVSDEFYGLLKSKGLQGWFAIEGRVSDG